MTKMEIGLYDVLDQPQMESHPLAADVYDEHIRGAQEAEQMGYKYYFFHRTPDFRRELSQRSQRIPDGPGPRHQRHAVRRDDIPVALPPPHTPGRGSGDAGPPFPGPGGVRRRHRRHQPRVPALERGLRPPPRHQPGSAGHHPASVDGRQRHLRRAIFQVRRSPDHTQTLPAAPSAGLVRLPQRRQLRVRRPQEFPRLPEHRHRPGNRGKIRDLAGPVAGSGPRGAHAQNLPDPPRPRRRYRRKGPRAGGTPPGDRPVPGRRSRGQGPAISSGGRASGTGRTA